MFSFISHLIIVLSLTVFNSVARINILGQGILPLRRDSVGMLFYINVENESYLQQYSLSTRRVRCCLKVDVDQLDCDSVDLVGGRWRIQPKEKRTLILVYPTTMQHDKVGFCTVNVHTRCETSSAETKRQVDIQFDTRIFGRTSKVHKESLFKDYFPLDNVQRCLSPDDDSFNGCVPTKCDLKYEGSRPFFDPRVRRCVPAMICLRNMTKKYPDVAYVPSGNVCIDLEQPVTADDLYLISVGAKTILPPKVTKRSDGIDVICNCSTLSQYFKYLADLLFGRYYLDDTYQNCSKEVKVATLAVAALIFTACWQLCTCVLAMVLGLKLREMWVQGSLGEKTSSAVYYLRNISRKMKKLRKPGKVANSEEEPVVAQGLMLNEFSMRTEKEIRQSVSDLCERMNREVAASKRYRNEDVGSRISLSGARSGRDAIGENGSAVTSKSERRKRMK